MVNPVLLDADSHVSEPLNLWRERLPNKYRAIAPHMVTEYDGKPGAWWCIEPDREPFYMYRISQQFVLHRGGVAQAEPEETDPG